jgi:hypothetical protein
MRASSIPVFLILAAAVGTVEPGRAAPRHNPMETVVEVRIRVEAFGRLSPASIAHMRREVDRIWSPAGVHLAWSDAPRSRRADQAPEPAPHVTVLIEHEASLAEPAASAEALARATLYHPQGGISRAVVIASLERARALIGNMILRTGERSVLADYLVPLVVGRAVAHEVGHYLLGSAAHSARGLMRSSFTPADAMAVVPWSSFALDRTQIRDLRTRWMEVQRLALAAGGPR